MPRVLLNFDRYRSIWTAHFIEADCRTRIDTKTRFYTFATLDALRALVARCNPEEAGVAEFRPKRAGAGAGEASTAT